MSRSRLKTPITGITTAVSEKWDKQKANRRLRAAIRSGRDPEVHRRAVSDPWGFAKDGKAYRPQMSMRK
jgi:hypothetical protein